MQADLTCRAVTGALLIAIGAGGACARPALADDAVAVDGAEIEASRRASAPLPLNLDMTLGADPAPERRLYRTPRPGLELSGHEDVRIGMLSPLQDEAAEIAPDAAPAGGGQSDLAAAAQNPIANTISVPFENNFYFHSGEDDETTYVLNFQPVIPIALNDDWNLISRPIIPLLYVPGAVAGLPGIGGEAEGFDDTFGLGDINYTAFFSPSKASKFVWGVGPSITFPTATDDVLGSGKWSAGPSFVGLVIEKPILAGVLLRQLWSFAGDSDRRSVNQTLIQPFLNYNLDDGWYLITAPVFTANWLAESSSDRWTAPLGGGVGKLFRLGDQPVNVNCQVYYNLERPENASDWQLKFTFQLLFPK